MHFPLLFVLFCSLWGPLSYAEVSFENQENKRQAVHVDKLYEEAEGAMLRGKWDEALRKLQLLMIRYPDTSYLQQAKLSTIVCYQQKKEYTRALIAINTFIRKYPQSEWLESVLQLKSEIESQKSSNPFSGAIDESGGSRSSAFLKGIVGGSFLVLCWSFGYNLGRFSRR